MRIRTPPGSKKLDFFLRRTFILKVAFFVLGIILLSFGYAALAGDTDSGTVVSCSIPAVPGLNAPPIDREK